MDPAPAHHTTFRHTPSSYTGQAVSPTRLERKPEEFKDLLIPPRVPERIRFPRASPGGTKTIVVACVTHNEGVTPIGTVCRAGITTAAVATAGALWAGEELPGHRHGAGPRRSNSAPGAARSGGPSWS